MKLNSFTIKLHCILTILEAITNSNHSRTQCSTNLESKWTLKVLNNTLQTLNKITKWSRKSLGKLPEISLQAIIQTMTKILVTKSAKKSNLLLAILEGQLITFIFPMQKAKYSNTYIFRCSLMKSIKSLVTRVAKQLMNDWKIAWLQ